MNSFYEFRRLFTLLLGGLFTANLYGQITGDVEVKALDRSGAAVSGAKVRVRNQDTGAERSAIT